MKRWMPRTSVTPATGMTPVADSVPARTIRAAPATPAAPFDVSNSTAEQRQLPRQIERRVRRLRDEHGRDAEIDRRAVQIERIASWNHETHHGSVDAEVLELHHDARQHGLGRGRAVDDEQLLLDVPDEAPEPEPVQTGDGVQDDRDEDEAGGIETGDQLSQRRQRPDAEVADRERHRAERAERRDFMIDADDAEQDAREPVDELEHRSSRVADRRKRKPEQDREQQHLEDVALRERVDGGGRNDRRAGNRSGSGAFGPPTYWDTARGSSVAGSMFMPAPGLHDVHDRRVR